MDRIKRSDVDARAQQVSDMLRGLKVIAQGRNGYIGLDLYQREGEHIQPRFTMVKTLTTGTKREVYEYLGAMLATLEMVGRD